MHMAEWTVQLTMWNVFMEDGPRTNKGWHNKVKKIAGKSHLNISEMVELFKLDQASTEVSLSQLMAGGALRSIPSKQGKKERRIIRRFKRNLTMETMHYSKCFKFLSEILDFNFQHLTNVFECCDTIIEQC